MPTINREIYKKLEDGSTVLVETIQVEVEEASQQDLIAEKESLLLSIYEELQALKAQQS